MKTRAVPLLALAMLAAAARGDLIVFDNGARTFILHPFHSSFGGWPGDYFDPTLSPASNPLMSETSLRAITGTAPTSSVYLDDYFECLGGGLRIAREDTPVILGTFQLYQYRATVFQPGQYVGPATVGASNSWQARASFSYSHVGIVGPIIGQSPFVGIRITLPDGDHYGWVRFNYQGVNLLGGPFPGASSSYVPIAWAYESTPNTPALVVMPCYANCDASSQPPVLNINDFQCFLGRFAAGDARANCDNSTTIPVLNVNDFQCFVNHFAFGCV